MELDADLAEVVVAGPEVVGPEVVGPEVAGPEVAGPEVVGPEVAGVVVVVVDEPPCAGGVVGVDVCGAPEQ